MRYLCIMTNFAQNNMGKTNISLYPHGGGISAILKSEDESFTFGDCGSPHSTMWNRNEGFRWKNCH